MRFFFCLLICIFFVAPKVSAQEYLNDTTLRLLAVSGDITYGYHPNHPARIGPAKNSVMAYLNGIKPAEGKTMQLKEISYNTEGQKGLVKATLLINETHEIKILYLLTTVYDFPMAPAGFDLKTRDDFKRH